MKNKKLTNEQIENRKHRLNKAKNITLYVSLAINVLVAICFAVVGCSKQQKTNGQVNSLTEVNQDFPAKVLRNERNKNNAVSGNGIFAGNANAVGYNILSLVDTLGDARIERSINFLYGQETTVIADASVRSGTSCYLSVNVHSPLVQNDYVYFENYLAPDYNTPRYRIQWRYLNNGGWTFTSGGSILVEEDLYLFTNRALNDSAKYFDDVFNTIDYRDISLPYDWNIGALYNNTYQPTQSTNGRMVTVAQDFVCYVNGYVYTSLRLHFSGSGTAIITDSGTLKVLNGSEFIDWVELYNAPDNKSLTIMSVDYVTANSGDTVNVAAKPNTLHFTNSNYQNIRLFDYNLTNSAINGYTIYDVFYINSSSTGSGSTGQIGDVFSLFTSAFSGLTGLFSISILPGITIGVLLFLPLVAIIVFAIIRVIKK